MPMKDGTGPNGKGPKRVRKGTPTPKRNGRGRQNQKSANIGRRSGNR
jgi:hypothetical protein